MMRNKSVGFRMSVFVYLFVQMVVPVFLIALFKITDTPFVLFLSFLFGAVLMVFLYKERLILELQRFSSNLKKNVMIIGRNLIFSYALNFISSLILDAVLGKTDSVNQENIVQMMALNPIYIVLSVVFLAPLIEEIVFRGFFFLDVKKATSKKTAYIVSSLVFGMIHVLDSFSGSSGFLGILHILPYAGMGFVLSLTVEETDSLWGGICLHMLSNGIAACAILFG